MRLSKRSVNEERSYVALMLMQIFSMQHAACSIIIMHMGGSGVPKKKKSAPLELTLYNKQFICVN